MSHDSSNQYLESKVFTASQPQLHLMLLVGAVRFGRQAVQLWQDEAEFEVVERELARVADIVAELTSSIVSCESDLSKQLEEQYAFIYRELASCRINQELEKLQTCVRLLEYERDTWKLACEKIQTESTTPPKLAPPAPKLQVPFVSVDTFSLEA